MDAETPQWRKTFNRALQWSKEDKGKGPRLFVYYCEQHKKYEIGADYGRGPFRGVL